MKTLTVTQNRNNFKIFCDVELYGEIIFKNVTDAELKIENQIYNVLRGENKDMVMTENGNSLFTFKFDKLWGGAKIIKSENYEGLEIKGRWFKLGTRLIDKKDNDLMVVVNANNGCSVNIIGNKINPLLIISTIYYHIYASRYLHI